MQPYSLDRRVQLQREADAIIQTVHVLASKGHKAWIASNEQGAPVMQTDVTVPPVDVLEAMATSWIRMGEPARKLACVYHFMEAGGRQKCRLRTCLAIVQSPGAGCMR